MSYVSFSPELAQDESGFKQKYFQQYAELESKNFWFNNRNQLIVWALRKYFQEKSNFLEIGCGNGFVLSAVAQAFPQLNIFGSDLSHTALEFALSKVPQATFYQMDARNIPFDNQFDVIGGFDMLEHLHEDQQVLSQMYQAVKPNGGIIITVPQHKILWSQHDVELCHVRRYSKQELLNKVIAAGFKMTRITSFVSLLLPAMIASRLFTKKNNFDCLTELKLPNYLNHIFNTALSFERTIIQSGINFPIGGSLLLIAHK